MESIRAFLLPISNCSHGTGKCVCYLSIEIMSNKYFMDTKYVKNAQI